MKPLKTSIALPCTTRLIDFQPGECGFHSECWTCGAEARVTCGRCKILRYCSPECRQARCPAELPTDTSNRASCSTLCDCLRTARLVVGGRVPPAVTSKTVVGFDGHPQPLSKSRMPETWRKKNLSCKSVPYTSVRAALKDALPHLGAFSYQWLETHLMVCHPLAPPASDASIYKTSPYSTASRLLRTHRFTLLEQHFAMIRPFQDYTTETLPSFGNNCPRQSTACVT